VRLNGLAALFFRGGRESSSECEKMQDSSLHHISHRFQDIADCSVFVTFSPLTKGCLSLVHSFGANSANIAMQCTLSKTRAFGLHFWRRQYGSNFRQFGVVGSEIYCWRTVIKDHNVVQGRSRSPMLVQVRLPISEPYKFASYLAPFSRYRRLLVKFLLLIGWIG